MDKASTDNPSVTRFISSAIEIPEPGVVRYNPFATNDQWSVVYVRHQQWESYEFHKNFTVAISAIGCYHINPEKLRPLVIKPEDFSRHHEVEVRLSSACLLQYLHSQQLFIFCSMTDIYTCYSRKFCEVQFLQIGDFQHFMV